MKLRTTPIIGLVAAALLAAGWTAPIAQAGQATGAQQVATAAAVSGDDTAPTPSVRKRPAVVERKTIGRSRKGRPIHAWRVGQPDAKRKVVLLSTMHGDEPHTRRILYSLRDGRPIRGVDMWLVPVLNPDGLIARTRKNARGVDLNRNYPHNWADLDGRYESGRRPGSEPETKALIKFLRKVKPDRLVSFHQPLHGVDTDTKRPAFARQLARALKLPRSRFVCGGVCHGTMTSWYNANFAGAALTVEYSARPSRHRMTVQAPRALLRVFGARQVRRG